MRISLGFMLGALILSGCGDKDTTVSQRDLLASYKELNIRLDRLSAPLLSGNQDLCDETKNDNGVRWHQLSDYPEALQPVSQSFWGVTETPSVFFVLAGSEADRAGFQSGDRPDQAALSALSQPNIICNFPILVSYTDEINAFATGGEIIVTSGMMAAIPEDDYLSLVIAHELSHNILKHHLAEETGAYEQEADRMAVYLMARADLDFEAAIRSRAKVRSRLSGSEKLPQEELDRISYFDEVSAEVRQRINVGAALTP